MLDGYFYPTPFLLNSLHKLGSLLVTPSILISFSPIVLNASVEASFLGGPPILTCYQLISISAGLLGSWRLRLFSDLKQQRIKHLRRLVCCLSYWAQQPLNDSRLPYFLLLRLLLRLATALMTETEYHWFHTLIFDLQAGLKGIFVDSSLKVFH